MTLTDKNKQSIKNTIISCLRKKFLGYEPESNNMPFHFRLLGKDRMALYSFIHSLATSFGTSIFEPVAVELAKSRFKNIYAHYALGRDITEQSQIVIQQIMNQLTIDGNPNKKEEISAIRRVCQNGKVNKLKPVQVDLFVEGSDGEVFLFDLKTAKPNSGNFKEFKRTLLEWIGIYLAQYPNAKVNSLIAIPYNPYAPKPYERWTLKGMLDLDYELKVGEEFWDFLGGKGAYDDILVCFEEAGIEIRSEIDEYFGKFKNCFE
jgi:type II restriction enzyme